MQRVDERAEQEKDGCSIVRLYALRQLRRLVQASRVLAHDGP
jgi:hypothetical protein